MNRFFIAGFAAELEKQAKKTPLERLLRRARTAKPRMTRLEKALTGAVAAGGVTAAGIYGYRAAKKERERRRKGKKK